MPFADVGRFVAGALQHAGKRDELVAASVMVTVASDSVRMSILSRQEASAAWQADRRGYEGIAEACAFVRDAVDVGSFNEGVARAAEGVPAEVIHENEDDVRAA